MESFLLGVIVGAVGFVAVGAPLVAPWPTRLRCLLAAQTPDPFLGLAPWSRTVMREVTVARVSVEGDTVEVVLADPATGSCSSSPSSSRTTSSRDSSPSLKAWCASGLPLLLIIDETGAAQLAGPERSATGFVEVSERVERSARKERVAKMGRRAMNASMSARAAGLGSGRLASSVTIAMACREVWSA